MFHQLDCNKILGLAGTRLFLGNPEWIDWRYCYEGGRIFRERYLKPFGDRESREEFERRREMTPIPGYAQAAVDKVKNSLLQRLPDVNRIGGSKTFQAAYDGDLGGVDLKGTNIDGFLARSIIPDLLVMGKIGTLVDAPELQNPPDGRPLSMADVPDDFRPFYNPYCLEDIHKLIPADASSPSDWAALLVEDRHSKVDIWSASSECVRTFRYFWLNPDRGNLLSIQKISEGGEPMGNPVDTDMPFIPFVLGDIGISLMSKVCAYQIAMLNMISADSSNSIDANFPIMVRQRSNDDDGHWLVDEIGGDGSDLQVGAKKGLWYGKNVKAPAFINQSSEPLTASKMLRDDYKTQVFELVMGTLTGLAEDGTIEAGLASIGTEMERYENRLVDFYTWYEEARPTRRNKAVIDYPTTWSLKTDEERINEALKFLELVDKLPGRIGKKAAIVRVYDIMFRGKVTTQELDKMKKAALDAPFTTSDPKIIFEALKLFAIGPQTAGIALGFDDDEHLAGAAERDRRAASMIAAQMDAAAGAARGVPEGSVDGASNEEGRAAEVEEARLTGGPAERGEGQNNEDEEETDGD